jgi:Cu2+-exporting ATPase
MHASTTPAAALDDPTEQSRFTTWRQAAGGERTAQSHFQLSGLVCAACAGLIEAALRREPGVREATVNYASRRASVQWDPVATRPSQLVAAIEAAGYGAAPDLAEPARALRQRDERAALWRLFVAVFCMMQVMMYAAPAYVAAPGTLTPDLLRLLRWASWLLCLPVLLFSAGPMFRDAWQGLRRGQVRMDLPVVIGLAVAFAASSWSTFAPGDGSAREVYFDTVAMFVCFLLVSRYLALRASHRVAATLDAALAHQPTTVRRLDAAGLVELVALRALRIGDRVRVLAGEAFAADGTLVDGRTRVDEALLTGESRPVTKAPGDTALAGSLNVDAPVTQRVERLGADTRREGVIALMRDALTQRPPLLAAADRVARPFLWGVLLLAAAAGAVWSVIDPSRALWVAVSVLIVTCPCALSLAAPSALLAAAGALARRGVLVRRLEALEALAGVDTVVFDKTGTLTDDTLKLRSVRVVGACADLATLHAMAASLAAQSSHPLSRALAVTAPRHRVWTDVVEQPGYGLQGIAPNGRSWRLGARDWVDPAADLGNDSAQVWFGDSKNACIAFSFDESLRPDARAAIDTLTLDGLAVALLSGDAPERVARVGARLGLRDAEGGATPERKLERITLVQQAGHRVAMVGDGLNDAPVVARADVSFAFTHGAAVTQATADFILLGTRVGDVVAARRVAQRAMRVLRQNLAWAATYNLVCVPLALAGLFPPWAAGLGMAVSSMGVVLNALRIGRGVAEA